MKGRIFLVALVMFFAQRAYAQYEPTTTWPYIYPDFTSGELQPYKAAPRKGMFNIHIPHGCLHFIEGDMIREVNSAEVFSVKVQKDCYVCAGGRLMKVLTQEGNVYVLENCEIDMNQLNATGGAYGSSSTTLATTALSSVDDFGTGTATNHMQLKSNKDNGRTLPLIKKKYILLPGRLIYATKKDVVDVGGVDASVVAAFIKENKIKWKEEQSLLKVGLFLNEKLNAK